MKKFRRVLIVGTAIISLLCFMYFGLWLMLCWFYPSEFAPNWIIEWQNRIRVSQYRNAAEQGNAEAQRELGTCYFLGIGVPMDRTAAVKWFHKAAKQGDAAAHSRLAYCYFYGEGVPEDKAEAVRRYQIAAVLGDIESQWKLGVFYLNGIELQKDETEAINWFRKAAEQDYYWAQYLLGRCYFEGTGVPKDDSKAIEYLKKARYHTKEASLLLEEIVSGNPRELNPRWGEHVQMKGQTPPLKRK